MRAAVIAVVTIMLGTCVWLARPVPDVPGVPARSIMENEAVARRRFGLEMRRLLAAEQYDSLESIASRLREERILWPNGSWKLRSFYHESFKESVAEGDEQGWVTLIGQLRRWVRERPESITARVALAVGLMGYASEARGNAIALTVKDEAWRLMAERLAQARQVLLEARELPTTCPGWWYAAQRVALLEGSDRASYERLVRQAVQREPTFDAYYEMKAQHLLARWHGERGEWERYAAELGDSPAAGGDARYARIVWFLSDRYFNIFSQTDASWERTRRGFEQLTRDHPESLELRSRFAYLAWKADDRDTARPLFVALAGQVDRGVWEYLDDFRKAHAWAIAR